MNETAESRILFARPADDCVVLRVVGRGTFQNSLPFKQTVKRMREEEPSTRFILDMTDCLSMDSTFMGVLASVGLPKQADGGPGLTIVNLNDHTRKLLSTLGLSHFLDVRDSARDTPPVEEESFETAEEPPVNKREQILHMIEAHEDLIDLDNRNKVRFENVLKYLNDSLDRADAADGAESS